MRYFSMFSGIGGFELGIQRAHSDCTCEQEPIRTGNGRSNLQRRRDSTHHNSSRTQSKQEQRCRICEWLCIGYSEIDKYAIATYEHHFKGHTNYGDATTIDERQLPDFELLVGGFPCQAFSIAGKRRGFEETRGTLFFDIARILKHKRPGHLVLENVKGLLSHDSGKTLQTILGVLTDLGYSVEWQVLNSKNFGVPQNRERIYIIGHLGNKCGRQVFPIGCSNQEYPAQANLKGVTNTLTGKSAGGQNRRGNYIAERQVDGQAGNIPGTNYANGRESYPKIRRLTPLECERLQGFPDNWTKGSDTQRYKQCGNAVTVNVVEAVMTELIPCLEAQDNGAKPRTPSSSRRS